MSTVVVEHGSVSSSSTASPVLARRGVIATLAVSGAAVAVGGALLVATSGHLVDPIAYGVQIGVMTAGAVAASLYSVANPVVGILLGILLLEERLSRPAWHVVLACIGLGLALVGAVVISLARERRGASARPAATDPATS